VVSRVDLAEVQNALVQAQREVATRFDFKDGGAELELDARQRTITLVAEDDQHLRSLLELLTQRLAKRAVSLRALDISRPEATAGGRRRQIITLRVGIPTEKAKAMQKLLRDKKLKVVAQIQDDQLRVFGDKKDDLQAAIALLRSHDFGLDLQFVNLR
jgi:uncharacterized protein YajQ (UPF0234 family)